MSRSSKALITPSVLEWARLKSGFAIQDIARKLQTRPEKVETWETGKDQPTIKQVRRIGRIVKRPLAFFYLPEPPKDFDAIKDFRRIPGKEAEPESPELLLAIRNAYERRSIALELIDQFDEEVTTEIDSIDLKGDAEDIAYQIRENLSLTYEFQIKIPSFYEALNHLKDTLESKGILIFQFGDVQRSEARGFSITDLPFPVIAVNRSEWPQARIFSVLHEYVHLALRQGGLCDFAETNYLSEEQRVEIFCNHVAGAILVPRDEFLNEPEVRSHISESDFDENDIKRLSKHYRSSREVVLRRLLIFKHITQQFYELKRREYKKEFEKARKKASGFAPPHSLALSTNGKLYTNIALRSYHEHYITASTLSEYLGVRLKHISKIEYALSSRRSF